MKTMQADLSGVDPLIVSLAYRLVVGDMPTRAAQTFGGHVAIMQGQERITYRQLEARANAVAQGLLAQGLKRGDALALQMGNRGEFLVAFFACAKLVTWTTRGWLGSLTAPRMRLRAGARTWLRSR